MVHNKHYIVIHGFGNGLADAFDMIRKFETFQCLWWDGRFHVPNEIGAIIRKVLEEGDEADVLFKALRKLAVSTMLFSCGQPENPFDSDKLTSFDEIRLIDNVPSLAIPFGPEARQNRAERLRREGESELRALFAGENDDQPVFDVVDSLKAMIIKEDGSLLTEEAAERILRDHLGSDQIVESLKRLRDLGERGADLDTISSAVFQAHSLVNQAKIDEDRELVQGRDFQFVFVFYHSGLKHLADVCDAPGELFMADIPIGAIPDLPGDLRFLREKNIHVARFDDHHPYEPEQMDMLNSLRDEGLIGSVAMSGPVQGEELAEGQMKCAGDMTYEALVMGRPWDNPAMAFLRECVHGEDLAMKRQDIGMILTELIKGGINTIELTQLLLSCVEQDDIQIKLDKKRWIEKIKNERLEVDAMSDKFMENVQKLVIDRPQFENTDLSGPAYGPGSDMPIPRSRRTKDQDKLTLLMVSAPKSKRNEPKLKIGRAQEFFSRTMPDVDYLLYCYGASIIVGRRLNQADTSLNLSDLMRKLGTESDGGHAGAAVCQPEKNPLYPKHVLGRGSSVNFSAFCRYVAMRLERDMGVKVRSRRDISIEKVSERHSKGSRQLMILIGAAVLLGLLVIMFNSDYRPDKILQLNSGHFQWLDRGVVKEPKP